MAYNSDGYIMIDFTEVDFRRTNQTIEGLFDRCQKVIGTNKFVIVINANNKTPLPSTVCITNGQYVIESVLFTFSISSADNLHITKKTTPEELIDDNHVTLKTTFSSNKINSELEQLADNINSVLPKKIYGTLSAGQQMLTIVDDKIKDNKTYWVGTNVFGFLPTNVSVNLSEPASISMTFPETQLSDVNVEVVII